MDQLEHMYVTLYLFHCVSSGLLMVKFCFLAWPMEIFKSMTTQGISLWVILSPNNRCLVVMYNIKYLLFSVVFPCIPELYNLDWFPCSPNCQSSAWQMWPVPSTLHPSSGTMGPVDIWSLAALVWLSALTMAAVRLCGMKLMKVCRIILWM